MADDGEAVAPACAVLAHAVSTAWRNPRALEFVLILTAFYLHLGPFAAFVVRHLEQEIAAEPPIPSGLATAIDEGSLTSLGGLIVRDASC